MFVILNINFDYLLDVIIYFNYQDLLDCKAFEKKNFLYWFNIYNYIYFLIYRLMYNIFINLMFYIIQIFIIFISSFLPNPFLKNFIYFFYKTKRFLKLYIRYIARRLKFYKKFHSIYRFYEIGNLKILFFTLTIWLLVKMWKRKHTYKKYLFIWYPIKFYMLSLLMISFLLCVCSYHFLSVLLGLLIVFFYMLCTLN